MSSTLAPARVATTVAAPTPVARSVQTPGQISGQISGQEPAGRSGWREAGAEAARAAGVIWAGLFALGFGFGVLTTGLGLPWWLAPVMSGLLFAGSVEFILVGLIAVSAPLAAIFLTTFLVNSRHLFYGLSYPLHRVRGRFAKAYSVFALCDEAYVLHTAVPAERLGHGRILLTQVGLHSSWAGGSLVGALVGTAMPAELKGLDFVLTALFVVLSLDAWRERPDPRTLLLAAVAAGFALLVTSGSAMMLVAMSAFTGLLVARHLGSSRRHRQGQGQGQGQGRVVAA